MGAPVVCKRQEPIITTAQTTVGLLQIQSEDQCRRVTSCSAEYAVRVLMEVRRACRLHPVDDCSWTVLTKPLGPESPDDDRGPQIQSIDESSRQRDDTHRVMSTRKGVSVEQPSSVQDPEVRAQTEATTHDIITVCDVTDKEPFTSVKGEIDKLFIENECDLTSQGELSTDEAKELADSLNLTLRDECHE